MDRYIDFIEKNNIKRIFVPIDTLSRGGLVWYDTSPEGQGKKGDVTKLIPIHIDGKNDLYEMAFSPISSDATIPPKPKVFNTKDVSDNSYWSLSKLEGSNIGGMDAGFMAINPTWNYTQQLYFGDDKNNFNEYKKWENEFITDPIIGIKRKAAKWKVPDNSNLRSKNIKNRTTNTNKVVYINSNYKDKVGKDDEYDYLYGDTFYEPWFVTYFLNRIPWYKNKDGHNYSREVGIISEFSGQWSIFTNPTENDKVKISGTQLEQGWSGTQAIVLMRVLNQLVLLQEKMMVKSMVHLLNTYYLMLKRGKQI